ncbi:hypothetical protein LSM04_001644 [Trypanosoma melophagium]|uniref:uncharacterized protein n=1 Tax=Trypanosoma melophagium TaxID=715481 RepID=UPI00351A9047|nr:hypothetical protein LSM04_001644 [Trypanosoma melophagium]
MASVTPPPLATVPPPPPANVPKQAGSSQVTTCSSYQPPLSSLPPPPPLAAVPSPPPANVPKPAETSQMLSSSSYQPPLPSVPLSAIEVVSPKDSASRSIPIGSSPQTAPTAVMTASWITSQLPLVDVLPTHIPVVPSVVNYNEQVQHVVVPTVRGGSSPSMKKSWERRKGEHHARPSMHSFTNQYLWKPSPSAEVTRNESWRGVYWEHLDVHRYIARRYRGKPPPIE